MTTASNGRMLIGMRIYRWLPCLVACVAFTRVVHADALSDVRAVLQRFPAKAPFSADASLQAKGRSPDAATTRTGATAFRVEVSRNGLSINVPATALAAAQTEEVAKKQDPENVTPTRTAMVALTIFDVIDGTDSAAMLLDALDGATLLDQAATTRNGNPATLLRIKVKPTLAGTHSRLVREPVIELRLWLDAKGVPVAAERESNYSASIVIATAANIRKESWEFAISGDRLYASRNEQEDRATAAGKSVVSWRLVTYAAR